MPPARGCSARCIRSRSTGSRACGSRTSIRSWRSTPTTCASSTRMHTDLPNHSQAFAQMHTGSFQFVRPSLGAWTLYGLGSENANLPGFITLNPPADNGGAQNYGSAFLPAICQGTKIGGNQIPDFYAALLEIDEEPGPPMKNIENANRPAPDAARAARPHPRPERAQAGARRPSSGDRGRHRVVRAGLPHAGRGARRARPARRAGAHPQALRHRRRARISSPGSACSPAAWPRRACGSSRSPPRCIGIITTCSRTSWRRAARRPISPSPRCSPT